MQPHKKISEKKSLFRWIVITAIMIVVFFQSFSLILYYQYWSNILINSYDEVLSISIKKYRSLKFTENEGVEISLDVETTDEEVSDKEEDTEISVQVNDSIIPEQDKRKLGLEKKGEVYF